MILQLKKYPYVFGDTDTTYFHGYIYPYAKLDFIKGRLKFVDLTGVSKKPTSAPFPSMMCVFVNTSEDTRENILRISGEQ